MDVQLGSAGKENVDDNRLTEGAGESSDTGFVWLLKCGMIKNTAGFQLEQF